MIENIANYDWYIMPNSEKTITLDSLAGDNDSFPLPTTDDSGGEVFSDYQPSEREIIECSSFTLTEANTGVDNSYIYVSNLQNITSAERDNPTATKLNRNYWILSGLFDYDIDETLPINRRLYLKNTQDYYTVPIFEAITSNYVIEGNYVVFDFKDDFFKVEDILGVPTNVPIPITYSPYKTFINGELVSGIIYDDINYSTNTKIKIALTDIEIRNDYNYCKIIFSTITPLDYGGPIELETDTGFLLLEDSSSLLMEKDYAEIVLHYNNFDKSIEKSTISDGTLFEYFLNNNLILELVESFQASSSRTNNVTTLSQRNSKKYDTTDITNTLNFDQIIDRDRVNLQDYEFDEFSIVGWNEDDKTMIIFTNCNIDAGLSYTYGRETNSQSISLKYLDKLTIEHNNDYTIKKAVRK